MYFLHTVFAKYCCTGAQAGFGREGLEPKVNFFLMSQLSRQLTKLVQLMRGTDPKLPTTLDYGSLMAKPSAPGRFL